MFKSALLKFITRLPYGGYKIIKILSFIFPDYRNHKIFFPFYNNIPINVDLTDNVVFPILKYGCYPHQTTEDLIFLTVLKKGDIVLDVGANIGYITALASKCVGIDGQIHSFEPSKKCLVYLNQLSLVAPQIKIWPYAVSNINQRINFIESNHLDQSHLNFNADNGYPVNAITLDSWYSNEKISCLKFLKIDVEGHDFDVLKGSENLIKDTSPIIEFEAFDLQIVNTISIWLNTKFYDHKFIIYRVSNNYPFQNLKTGSKTNNYFAIPQSRISEIPTFLTDFKFLDTNLT